MSDILDARLQPPREVVFTAVGQEAVLLHTGTNIYFGLDELGSLVFQRLTDGVRPRLIVEEIVETFDVDRERATSDLNDLLRDFMDNRLMVLTPRAAT